MSTCIHAASGVELLRFDVPYMGEVLVCRPCRRELALRTVERPRVMAPIDCGRIGYRCSVCGGEFTSTDPMTCTCPGRVERCRHRHESLKAMMEYWELVRA